MAKFSWIPWYHRQARDADLARELRDHLHLEEEDQQAAGLSPEQAANAAHRALGNTLKIEEDVRATWGLQWLETLVQDMRYSFRTLRKSPGFTAVAILTLALGIGATTAVFCLAHAVFWRALPYRDANNLTFLSEGTKSIPDLSLSYPDFLDWQQQVQAFDGIAAYQDTNFDFVRDGKPERISGRNVSANFFQILGISPALGRSFVAADNSTTAPAVVLLSYRFWQTSLSANPRVVGTTIRLDGRAFTVVGVLPHDFSFETPADVYTPIGQLLISFLMHNRAKHPFIYAIARLGSGATFAQAQTELQTIARRLQQEYPTSNGGVYPIARPLHQELAKGAQPTLLALAIAVGLLLLISCANVANLLLAQASRREAEFAIRVALGARHSRIIRQAVTESVLLGLLGGTCGLVLASASLSTLRLLIPAGLASMISLHINMTTVLFALGACLVSAVSFGLFPFLLTSRRDFNERLKSSVRAGGLEFARHRLRSALVVLETAFAFVVLVSAGLVFRSFRLASQVNPGFDVNNVLTMRIEVSRSSYATDNQLNAFFQRALGSLRRIPGISNAAAVFPLPLTSNGYSYRFYIEGQPVPYPSRFPSTDFHFVTQGYFDAMGIPLVRGRDFFVEDNEKAPRVAIISKNFAARYWPGLDPIGKRIHLDPAEGGGLLTVVGVVGNTKESGLDTSTSTELYLPYTQTPIPFMTFVLRTTESPLALSTTAVSAIHSIDGVDPLYSIRAMNEYAADALAKRRTNAFLFCAIGVLIIMLSSVGVYAVISSGVTQRTHEIGIRMALGAQQGAILRFFLKSGAALLTLGIAIGAVAALVFARVTSNLLFGVSAADPLTFFVVGVLLGSVTLIACYIPARRAMKVDPMVALRYE